MILHQLTNEVDDISTVYGKDEDATSCPTFDDYEAIFQSTDVEEPTSFPIYDVDDDMDPTPHPIYDRYDDECIEYDNEGDDLVDENESGILYEEASPQEAHHRTISSSELVGPLCDIPFHVNEIKLHDLWN